MASPLGLVKADPILLSYIMMEPQSGSVAVLLALYAVESVIGKYSAALNRYVFA